MILVDTSVWIDHLRKESPKLAALLGDDEVAVHPFILGELACGSLRNRRRILTDLESLPRAAPAGHDDVMRLVEQQKLWGKGIGWVDCHLLSSALLSGCRLWTLDAALRRVASALGVE